MYPAEFEYRKASSIADAVRLLSENPDAKLLAGGHSLIPLMRFRLARPEVIIDIGGIDGLRGIRVSDGTINIGALTTHAEIANSADFSTGPYWEPFYRGGGFRRGRLRHRFGRQRTDHHGERAGVGGQPEGRVRQDGASGQFLRGGRRRCRGHHGRGPMHRGFSCGGWFDAPAGESRRR